MSKVVNVKGYGKAVFPDHFTPDQMRTALRKRFNPVGAVEAAGTVGSAIVAEPVSGLAGIAGAILPGKEGQGADWVKSTQDALTYQPRTESGQDAIRSIGEKLAPIGEIIEGASKKLGDKTYAATESPALAAAAYSAPTAFLEGLGLKGLSIAKAPTGSMNLSTARSGFGAVTDAPKKIKLYHGSPVEFDKFDPARVGDRITSLGLGHYLTPNKEMAKQYGDNVMEFEVDVSSMLDWQNMTPAQRLQVEGALTKAIPESRISHFGEMKYEVLPSNKDGAARFRELKEKTKDAYNDYAKARVLDDDEIESIDPELLNRLGPNDTVVGWKENGSLKGANTQQLMTLMNEFIPDLAKQLGYKASKFSDQVAIYEAELAKRIR